MTDAATIREIQRLMDMSRPPAPGALAQDPARARRIAALLGIGGEKDEGGRLKDEKENATPEP